MDGGIDDVLHKPVGVGGGTGFPEEIDPVVDLQAGDREGGGGGGQTLTVGSFHGCAVVADSTVRCWGQNSHGQLGDGTDESHERAQQALDSLWRYTGELFDHDAVDDAVAAEAFIAIDHDALQSLWLTMVKDVVQRAALTLPDVPAMRRGGRRGFHTESLGHMLATMQSVARSHPGAAW